MQLLHNIHLFVSRSYQLSGQGLERRRHLCLFCCSCLNVGVPVLEIICELVVETHQVRLEFFGVVLIGETDLRLRVEVGWGVRGLVVKCLGTSGPRRGWSWGPPQGLPYGKRWQPPTFSHIGEV